MRLFSRSSEIEISDLRVGRIKIRVKENFLDRLAAFVSPGWGLQRLRDRAALAGPGHALPPARRVISKGMEPPKKEGFSHWG
jgi:hypothetical protein